MNESKPYTLASLSMKGVHIVSKRSIMHEQPVFVLTFGIDDVTLNPVRVCILYYVYPVNSAPPPPIKDDVFIILD